MVKKILTYSLAFMVLLLPAAPLAARGKSGIIFWSEAAAFNRSYHDLRYADNDKISFPCIMSVFGAEFTYRNKSNASMGGGLVQNYIYGASKLNVSQVEVQPDTAITIPYVFGGKHYKWFGIELGISAYLYAKNFSGRSYLATDGTEVPVSSGVFDLDNRRSHAFVNASLRILQEDSFHMKVLFGRDRFSAVDSLFAFRAVLPTGIQVWELTVSLLPPWSLFDHDSTLLRSNQRIDLAWSIFLGPVRLGVETGVLLNNTMGGNGSIEFLNRLHGGIFMQFLF